MGAAHSPARKILDYKRFIKHYDKLASDPLMLKIQCNIELVDEKNGFTAPPPELLLLPVNATVSDLKMEATKAFRETYIIFEKFKAEQLVDFVDVIDSTSVRILLGSIATVSIRGRCNRGNKYEKFRKERGLEDWIIDCVCRAKDDDGERMLACDSCGVWQHTRCNGIEDYEAVPDSFKCMMCSMQASNNSNCSDEDRRDEQESEVRTVREKLESMEKVKGKHSNSHRQKADLATPIMEVNKIFHRGSCKEERAPTFTEAANYTIYVM